MTIIATAPSVSMLQSKSRSGSEIMREAWWSARVIGVRMTAAGLRIACPRNAIATSAYWSSVVPYSMRWRMLIIAISWKALTSPCGTCHWFRPGRLSGIFSQYRPPCFGSLP